MDIDQGKRRNRERKQRTLNMHIASITPSLLDRCLLTFVLFFLLLDGL